MIFCSFYNQKEDVTKRKKRAWWKQKSEQIAEHRFETFRTSLVARHSSFVLEPDYADITKRLRFTSQPIYEIRIIKPKLIKHSLCSLHQGYRIMVIPRSLNQFRVWNTGKVEGGNFTRPNGTFFSEDHLIWLFNKFTGECQVC